MEKFQDNLVSVITPSYNSERFIKDTIESVLAQTYQNWEMIIVDDCSTDGTVRLIRKYQRMDRRIKLFRLKQNSGPAVARNLAIGQARGRYIAFLDSDDQWLPNKLAEQLQFMKENQIAFSYTQYRNMNESGKPGSVVSIPDQVTYEDLLKHNVIGCLTVMLDRKVIGKVQMVNLRSRQDYALWLSILKKGYTAYGLQKVLAKYRNVENSLSSNKIKMARQNWRVYREVENISLIKSLYYFSHYAYFKLKKYKWHIKIGR
ncbi:glycosyltransferase family 2 protein [Calidifontibacillus erzurumensis]|uniref:glycosyltransferase family 2 protein n=1 Tax=Calidifontibacillus erzurumensis TaxID=2741433 RepID=UPI0035B50803